MIISDEQVRRCVEYLQTTGSSDTTGLVSVPADVSFELLERVRAELALEPDTRQERVDQARSMLAGVTPTSREVVDKMIGRIVSDSLR